MSRRRLAIVAPSCDRGGAEDYLATIARAAVAAGWEVHAGVSRAPGVATLRQDFREAGVELHPLPIGAPQVPGAAGAASQIARDLVSTAAYVARVQPAVALTMLPNPETSPGAMLATTALRVPALVVFQLVPPDLKVGARRRRLYALARRRQRWVAISDDNRSHLARAFGFEDRRLIRIYNGVPLAAPPSAAERREARAALVAELGVGDDAKLILTVGRLSRQKGHDLLLEAVPAVRARAPDALFVWAGGGESEGGLRRRIEEIGAADGVRLLGHRSDVRRLLAAADLFVFPSRYEGFGLALAEAMAAAVPVVAADCSAVPEIVGDDRHGLLFRLGDRDQLADRIAWALGHRRETSAMARRAAARVAERYGEDEMIARTLGELAELAEAR
jgi:glycosyltransferase involved in cell wall biosynthesis